MEIRWVLIGASQIARQFMIAAIRERADGEVLAVVSANAEEFDIPNTDEPVDKMLANPEIDAVYISTTNERHHAQTPATAAAGKHVPGEKPLALTLEQAQEMAEACRRSGVVFASNHHLRGAATRRKLRALIVRRRQAARMASARSLPHWPYRNHSGPGKASWFANDWGNQ